MLYGHNFSNFRYSCILLNGNVRRPSSQRGRAAPVVNPLLSRAVFLWPCHWYSFRGCWRDIGGGRALVPGSLLIPGGTWHQSPGQLLFRPQGWLRRARPHWQIPGQLCSAALQKAGSRESYRRGTAVNLPAIR